MVRIIRQDQYFFLLIIAAEIIGFSITLYDFVLFQKSAFRFDFISLSGVAIILIGLMVRLVSKRELGRNFSYVLRTFEEQELVTKGIYKYIRHPAYSGLLLIFFGIPIFFDSLIGLIAMMLLVPCIIFRIKIEEKMLIERFGQQYVDYSKKTKKLIPFVY